MLSPLAESRSQVPCLLIMCVLGMADSTLLEFVAIVFSDSKGSGQGWHDVATLALLGTVARTPLLAQAHFSSCTA